MSHKVSFKWNKNLKQVVKDVTGGEKTLLFAANEGRRLMNKYVPMDTGTLADSGQPGTISEKSGRPFIPDQVEVAVEDGRGVVDYKADYAAANYYGSSRNFSDEKHRLATAYWDKAMEQAEKGKLTEAVQKFIDKGGWRK